MTGLSPHVQSPPTEEALAWVQAALGSGTRVTAMRRLAGGTSSAVHGLTCRDAAGNETALVLRRFTLQKWLDEEPDLAPREANVLKHLEGNAVPAPRLVAVDSWGEACDVPAVLMTKLPGRIELAPADLDDWLLQMATTAAAIHDIDWHGEPPLTAYFPWVERPQIEASVWPQDPDRWHRAVELMLGPEPAYTPRFLHRDYHPGNILWQDGRLSGVVDWVNGCYGPPDVDLAHCRDNIVDLHGLAAADRFLAAYTALTGRGLDPYWELLEITDCGLGSVGFGDQWVDLGLATYSQSSSQLEQDAWIKSVLDRL